LTTYEVTLTEQAEVEVERSYLWHSRRSPEVAARWYAGLLAALEPLSMLPRRCPVALEDQAFPDVTVRQLVYGSRRSAYRILFYVIEPTTVGEPGVVRVLHVLHGAQQRLGQPDQSEDEGAE
jgi:plasmid stabilization system protein ParE